MRTAFRILLSVLVNAIAGAGLGYILVLLWSSQADKRELFIWGFAALGGVVGLIQTFLPHKDHEDLYFGP
jgi:hypothetical protein